MVKLPALEVVLHIGMFSKMFAFLKKKKSGVQISSINYIKIGSDNLV